MLGSLQWAMVAIGLPTTAAAGMLGVSALPVFGLMACVHAALIWLARLAYRDLYGQAQPWQETLQLVVSPLHAMRSAEHVGREAMVQFDPRTALLAAGRPEQFLELARSLHHAPQEAPVTDSAHLAWWRSTVERAYSGLLRQVRLSPAHFDLTVRSDETAQSFCPRCHAMYAEAAGFCTDCEGMALRRLNPQQLLDARRVLERIDERRPR